MVLSRRFKGKILSRGGLMKTYREYKLLKEVPEGVTKVQWISFDEIFTNVSGFEHRDKRLVSYTLDFIISKPEWFEGIGEPRDFYPKLPDQKDFFKADGDGHSYGDVELSHNDMCRTCQLLKKLWTKKLDVEIQTAIYNILLKHYNKQYKDKF